MEAIMKKIEQQYAKTFPQMRIGDTLQVEFKVKEGENERLQIFEGVLIARRGSGTGATIAVRKISFGVGVEKIFPLCSPLIESIKILKHAKVRRAKLYYLREKKGREARLVEDKIEK